MDKREPNPQIVRAIETMEGQLGETWAGASIWGEVVQQTAVLIVDLKDRINSPQLAMLMSIGALAHRQSKIERLAEGAAK